MGRMDSCYTVIHTSVLSLTSRFICPQSAVPELVGYGENAGSHHQGRRWPHPVCARNYHVLVHPQKCICMCVISFNDFQKLNS